MDATKWDAKPAAATVLAVDADQAVLFPESMVLCYTMMEGYGGGYCGEPEDI